MGTIDREVFMHVMSAMSGKVYDLHRQMKKVEISEGENKWHLDSYRRQLVTMTDVHGKLAHALNQGRADDALIAGVLLVYGALEIALIHGEDALGVILAYACADAEVNSGDNLL